MLGFGLIKVEIKYLSNKVKLNFMVRDESQPYRIGPPCIFHSLKSLINLKLACEILVKTFGGKYFFLKKQLYLFQLTSWK